jgi:hypothetical protein
VGDVGRGLDLGNGHWSPPLAARPRLAMPSQGGSAGANVPANRSCSRAEDVHALAETGHGPRHGVDLIVVRTVGKGLDLADAGETVGNSLALPGSPSQGGSTGTGGIATAKGGDRMNTRQNYFTCNSLVIPILHKETKPTLIAETRSGECTSLLTNLR